MNHNQHLRCTMLEFVIKRRINLEHGPLIIAVGSIDELGVVQFDFWPEGDLQPLITLLRRYRAITNGQPYNISDPQTGITVRTERI